MALVAMAGGKREVYACVLTEGQMYRENETRVLLLFD